MAEPPSPAGGVSVDWSVCGCTGVSLVVGRDGRCVVVYAAGGVTGDLSACRYGRYWRTGGQGGGDDGDDSGGSNEGTRVRLTVLRTGCVLSSNRYACMRYEAVRA